jgi:hypothetical protein
MFLMRILTPSLALVLGLALAPAGAMAQAIKGTAPGQSGSGANNSQPVGGPGVTSTAPLTQSGSGANNSQPVGGPAITGLQHKKYHKRSHHKFYGKHHDYTKSSPAKGPSGAHVKTTGTD